MIGTIAGIALGIVFLVAGGSKLAAGPRWPAEAAALGAPRVVVPFVPWVELVVGGLLVAGVAEPWPAIAALVILVVYTALLAARLREGQRPPCACFGAWSSKPLGRGHLVRNAVFLAIGVVAIAA